jgi:hypothetical protein
MRLHFSVFLFTEVIIKLEHLFCPILWREFHFSWSWPPFVPLFSLLFCYHSYCVMLHRSCIIIQDSHCKVVWWSGYALCFCEPQVWLLSSTIFHHIIHTHFFPGMFWLRTWVYCSQAFMRSDRYGKYYCPFYISVRGKRVWFVCLT